MKIRPSVVHTGNRAQIFFQSNITSESSHKEVSDFIAAAYEKYFERYARSPKAARASHCVDTDTLAAILISACDFNNEETPKEMENTVTIRFDISSVPKNEMLPAEVAECQLHRYSAISEQEGIITIHPVGFQTLDAQKSAASSFTLTTIFDLRVQVGDIEASRNFYLTQALPKLAGYIEEIKEIFLRGSNNEFNVDTEASLKSLHDTIWTHYESRLADPSDNKRQVLFLDVSFSGTEKDNTTVAFTVRRYVDETSTPHLPVTHQEYQATMIEKDTRLSSFSSTRTTPVSLEVQSTDQPQIIERSAADELNLLTAGLTATAANGVVLIDEKEEAATETQTETLEVTKSKEEVVDSSVSSSSDSGSSSDSSSGSSSAE